MSTTTKKATKATTKATKAVKTQVNDVTVITREEVKATATKATAVAEKQEAQAGVKYVNFTSKKNLLAVHTEMDTEKNYTTLFKNGFTYSITTDNKYVAVTYYFSKGNRYEYAVVKLDDKGQAVERTTYDSIKAVKQAIAELYK